MLLDYLDVWDVSHVTQVTAIRDWLAANTPSPALVRSLRQDGYAEALDAAA
ncbi:MAG: hypothetical protein QM621_11905 [Aeromicrobium sp.]|uniref:hypothetical protein n=1 Tax=Aeromicrobium sp. TaxID=1871063 RepID=UPI0039E46FC1